MNKCVKCGAEFEGNFCPNCGNSADGKKHCAYCGAEISEEAKFCNVCGKSLTVQEKKRDKNVVSEFFVKAGKWTKNHVKAVIASTVALVAVIVILSVTIPLVTDIFRAEKVSKISLGDTYEDVIKILGKPDNEKDSTFEWYGENYMKLAKKTEKLAKKKIDSFDSLAEIMEESEKLEQEAEQLVYKYIRIKINSKSGVTDILFDTKHRNEYSQTKKVKEIRTDKIRYGASIQSGVVKTEIYYEDGSYRQFNLSLGHCDLDEYPDLVRWSDEWGSYETTIGVVK